MPEPREILMANIQSTRFPDLRADLKLTTANPDRGERNLHILSRWQPNVGGGTLDVMGRSSAANDIPFLIHQVLQPPSIDLHVLLGGQLRHEVFVPWDPIPQTDLMNADQVLLPGTFTAVFSPAGTMPTGPGPVPAVACWLVDLQLPDNHGPNLVRMWIEQSLTKALDHRIEQYHGDDLLRVIVSDGWMQVPGLPWGATKRTFIDAPSRSSTTLTVENADPSPLAGSTFSHATFISTLW